MSDHEQTLTQIRTVAKWWVAEARADENQVERDGDWHAQAARASRRQADDWHALGDLLQAAAAHQRGQSNSLTVQHFVLAAERLADRLDPDWRRVSTEESGGDG